MTDLSTLVAALVPLAFMIYWVTDAVKDVTNRDVNGIVTKVAAYVGAWVVVSLYAHSQVDLGGSAAALAALPWQGTALIALAIAAGGGSFSDYLRARNAADTSVKSKLLPKP